MRGAPTLPTGPLGMADVRHASRDDDGTSADDPTCAVELTDVSPADVPVPSWPMLAALRKVALVVWKNLQLRGNRPVATIMEVVFPLIAFVALSVMTPRNEYYDAPYFPGVPWMPPACVLQFDVPSALVGVSHETAMALEPGLCPGAGHLAGPHVTVPFAPDTDSTRALMRAACELRYAPPGIERVAYGYTSLRRDEEEEDEAEADETSVVFNESSSRRRRRHLLFGPSDPSPGPPSPPSPPAPPAWPACSPEGYADEEWMARAAPAGAGAGGASAVAVAFSVREDDGVVTGYEIRARADAETKALEMQERLGDVLVSLAGTGDVNAVSEDLAQVDREPIASLFRQFPFPPVYPTSTYGFVAKFLPLAVAVTWTYTLLVCAGNVAYERETGLEASMRAFGLPLWTHWAGHGLACALLLGAAALFCGATVTSFGAALFVTGESGRFVFLLLALTVCAALSSCFVVATLATDASVAAAGTAVAWLVSYLPYAYVSRPDSKIESALLKALLCFAPSSAQGLGFAAMAQWEAQGVGSSWGNLWVTPPANSAGDIGVPLGAALLILLLDFVGFAVIALKIDAARFKARRGGEDAFVVDQTNTSGEPQMFLKRDGATSGIVAENLCVEYPGLDGAPSKLALRGLNLHCPVGEITVLLGHNGAGKSSAISRLVGSAPPSSGRCTVGGHDAVSEKARHTLGFCPQHDALWDDLTVQDHIDFVLRLRGTWGRKALEEKRNLLLREVELRAKKRTRAGALSGGMRRRLSVALAFAGDPSHVVLDEPTAGVDPRARRQIQHLLQKKAKGKAVLVTTHHLDEAERLGTRVAVLHQGSLVCAGSSKELKTKYDVGYRLVVTLMASATEKADGKESVAKRLASLFASKTPPISESSTDRGGVMRDGAEGAGEVSFSWPGSLAGYLPAALKTLAREKEALGVAGYGLAAPSLDGVFKAVQEENEAAKTQPEGAFAEDASENASDKNAVQKPKRKDDDDAFERSNRRFSATVVAVFLASLRAFRRDRARLVATFVAPTFLLLAASAMAAFRATPSTYGASFHVPVSGSPSTFIADCAAVQNVSAINASAMFETAFATRASFETFHLEPANFSGSNVYQGGTNCFPEEALWRAFRARNPSSLNPRQARDTAGVAAGAGGQARAATVWWSSERVRRAASAAVTRTRAVERFESAFGGGGTASEIAVAAAAADAADAAGAFRPWPKTDDQTRRALLASTPGPAAAAAAAVLAVSVPPCLAAAAAAKQRASGLRRVLLVAGAPKLAHWLGIGLADLAVVVPATLFHVLAFCVAGGDALLGEKWSKLPDAFALFYAHAFASLAAAHLVALYIGEESAHKAFQTCLLLGALPATALVGVTYALDALGDVAGAETAFAVARVFPGFAVGQGTLELALSSALAFPTASLAERGKAFEFAKDVITGERLMASYAPRGGGVDGLVYASVVVCLVAVALAFLLDGISVTFRAFLERCVSSEADVRRSLEAEGERDADVVAEELRLKDVSSTKRDTNESHDVETGVRRTREDPTDALRVFGLRKSYLGGDASKPAVRDLWLGVKAGECFGLLGINGCGKTTTFRMAAGDLPPTAGYVEIGNRNANERMRKQAKNAVGYCPQKDAIVRSLTVTEHLRLIAAARGLPSHGQTYAEDLINSAVENAGLGAFANVGAGSLSGGNRRKLCLAMALFGLRRNSLALLDEPTAGVDPGARDQITETIRDAAKNKKCACVVTSHAVEDVAALCHRVGVMVDGAMLCLGAPQHLRTTHGKHLTLTVHAEARAEQKQEEEERGEERRKPSLDLDAFVRDAAPGATRVGAVGDGETGNDSMTSGAAQRAARLFGFIEGVSEADDSMLSEAKRIAARGAADAENKSASPTWELPASADLPSVLEALERLRADDSLGIEGYAVGQASLEDVFLEFASRGAAQSDAQMMAMEDALHAHRLALSKK